MILKFKDGERLEDCETIVKGRTFLLVKDNISNDFLIVNLKKVQKNADNNLQQQAQTYSIRE